MKKYQLKELQTEIKANAAEARAYNPRIQAASGLEKHGLRVKKAAYGGEARYMLLAYGFLRDLPYKMIEQKVGEGNSPFQKGILDRVKVFLPETTLDEITSWLEEPTMGAIAVSSEACDG